MRHTMRRSYDGGDSGTGGWTLNTVVANGLVIGAIYGLVALGITLVYKKSRVLNFAHGEVGMVGAFVRRSAPGSATARPRWASPPAAPAAGGTRPSSAGEPASDGSAKRSREDS